MKKILVTGAAGYIGSVLIRQLLEKEYFVRGVDALYFGGESLLSVINHPNFEFIRGDLRNSDVIAEALNGSSDIIHLAAIVGDPACAKQPDLAREINWTMTKAIFDAANQGSVKQFIFASTCSNYGKMKNDSFVTEESDLSPVSLYAELKVKFESYLLTTPIRDTFSPTALRFSTVYGLSSRMRFDLTVNEFIRDAAFKGELTIFGEQFWRPYCHVEDLASACIKVLESPIEKVRKEVFNVGDTKENYQKKMIAEEILKILPNTKINYITKQEDPRDYRVNFSKIQKVLNFRVTKTLAIGLKEIHRVLSNGIISDPYLINYRNTD